MQNIDEHQESRISLIAALGTRTRAIGKGGELLWRLPEDLKRFKTLTSDHPVIMGRKTWESLPEKSRPLPGRTNIVVTRDDTYAAPGALLAHSLPEALSLAKSSAGANEVFVIGGGELYRAALPFATHLYLTLIDDEAEGDAFFPAYEEDFLTVLSDEGRSVNNLQYRFLDLSR